MKYALLCASLFALLACAFSASEPEIIASVGPNGQYATLTAAYNYLATLKNTTARFVVEIEAGTYTEQLTIKKANFTFRASSQPVVIQFNSPRNTKGGANNASFTVDTNGVNFRMHDITIVDIAPETVNIATTALSIAAYNTSFYNCKIYGFQDTLWLRNARSYAYFKNCYVEGGVDFIYGSGIAFFDSCTLASNRAGSVTAMQGGTPTGTGTYVFQFCNIIPTLPSGPLAALANSSLSFADPSEFPRSCYLGRPWDQYARVVFLYSNIGEHIAQEGWTSWSVPTGQLYGEYNNTGRGAFNPGRVDFATLLTPENATNYTFEKFFGENPFWLAPNVAVEECPAQWGQCGGIGFSGKTCCQAPYVCQYNSEWYSQCVAGPINEPVVDTTVTLYNKPPADVESISISNEVQGSVSWGVGAPGSNIVVQAAVDDVVLKNVITTVNKVGTDLSITVSYLGAAGPTFDVFVFFPHNFHLSNAATSLYSGAISTVEIRSYTTKSCSVHVGSVDPECAGL